MEEKKRIRKEVLAIRNSLSEEIVIGKSRRIKETLFEMPEFRKAGVIMFYVAKDREVRTEEMIRESLKMDKGVAVPVSRVKERDLVPALLTHFRELVPGTYGILEPGEEHRRLVPLEEIDLIIVPGIAFDCRGNRIGFGNGFYDNFLRGVPASIPRFGLAFDSQVVEELPVGERDVPVDGIVTEERIYLRDKAQRHKVTKAQRA